MLHTVNSVRKTFTVQVVIVAFLIDFSDFSQDDQLILIKLGFFEVWLSHVTKIATEADALLTFDDGSYLTKEQLEILYDVSDA